MQNQTKYITFSPRRQSRTAGEIRCSKLKAGKLRSFNFTTFVEHTQATSSIPILIKLNTQLKSEIGLLVKNYLNTCRINWTLSIILFRIKYINKWQSNLLTVQVHFCLSGHFVTVTKGKASFCTCSYWLVSMYEKFKLSNWANTHCWSELLKISHILNIRLMFLWSV